MTELAPMTQRAAAHPSSDAPLVLECHGLTKTFKDFWLRDRVRAVKGIDLRVHQGEVFGLLGPNGCGKSTTIKMILGLLFPTKGSIHVFGRAPTSVRNKSRIGYLPEETNLYPFLTAHETLDYFGRLFHLDREARNDRSEQLLDMLGLADVRHRPVGEYSKGMQRRIGLAQALINDPDLLILDEPTNGLDPVGTAQVKSLILDLRQRGKTVLVCSHLLADLEQICDRVAIMYGGEVSRFGTLDELLVLSDSTILRTGPLSTGTVEEVERLLDKKGEDFQGVEASRQTLESLFLTIVEEAQSRGADTSGARSGGRIASFLSGPSENDKSSQGTAEGSGE